MFIELSPIRVSGNLKYQYKKIDALEFKKFLTRPILEFPGAFCLAGKPTSWELWIPELEVLLTR